MEFAFVLPVFLILIVIVMALSSLFFTQIVLLNAAWEGARAGATIRNPEHGDQEIIGSVHSAAYGLDLERLVIEIDPAQDESPRNQAYPAPRGEPICVALEYQIKLPGIGLLLPLTSRAVTTMEYLNP